MIGSTVYCVISRNINGVEEYKIEPLEVVGLHLSKDNVVYELLCDEEILKRNVNQVANSFGEAITMVESSEGGMKVCYRCSKIFNAGEGFEIPGLHLCDECVKVVKNKLSEDSAEPEIGKCECSCKNEKCDCERCECDSEKVVVSDEEAIEEEM